MKGRGSVAVRRALEDEGVRLAFRILGTQLEEALRLTPSGIPAMAEIAIDYSRKTFFTRGVVITNLCRLPWSERLRLLGRGLARRITIA